MIKYLLFVFAFFPFNVYGQLNSAEQTNIDNLFKTWNNSSSPGFALGIIRDGKLIYSKGYGMSDLEHDVPITDSTIFYIGSVSKQFVTMCVLLLEEQGRLNLDDRIQKYLPDFPEYNAPLTIRHFIHHTSGVRDNLTLCFLAGIDALDHVDKEEMYQLIKRQKQLNFSPGEKYLYSNSCYFMLGLIIEKASGMSLNEFAQKNIFEPLGMHKTIFLDDNTRIIKNRAFCYLLENGKYKNQIMRYDLVGSGGVYSNIRDLYLWDQNFYHNKLGKGSQALINKMHTEDTLNSGKSTGYAYALRNGTYRGLRTVSHSGAFASYRSNLLRFPEQKLTVIVLGNVTPIEIEKLSYNVVDVILEKLLQPLSPADKTNSSVSDPKEIQKNSLPDNVKQYEGSFYSDELDVTYQITEENNQLYCSIKSKQPFALRAKSQDLFTMNDFVEMKFERDNKNKIFGISLNAGRVTDLKFTRK